MAELGKKAVNHEDLAAYHDQLMQSEMSQKVDKTTKVNGHTLSGDVTVDKEDVGLENVGNFKAVSTVASQGLSDTEKANARTNIGAGTSSFSGSYNDLLNKPTIPSVAQTTGTSTTAVMSQKAVSDLIPAQASASNQLADKNFVNNSVSTATAGIKGNATSACDTLGEAETKINANTSAISAEASRAQAKEALLQNNIEALTQSNIVVVADHTSVSSPDPLTIYREQGTNAYSDWMYQNGSWNKMATYDNATDDVPTAGSDNLVKSGGVYDKFNLINSFVGATDETESIKAYADDHSYILYYNLALYVNQSFKTKVCYFEVEKYKQYHVYIPKTGNSAMAIACYSSTIITASGTGGFSAIKDINAQDIGAGNDGAFSFDYLADNDGYLAIVYNTTANEPTCDYKKCELSERVSKLENKKASVDFDFNDVYDVTNYGLFVDIIAEMKYDNNGILVNDSNYNATSLTYLDRNNDIVICNITNNNRIVFFDKEMNFIDYIDGGYAINAISKNNFPQNALYVAFSYPTNIETGALFSTRQERVKWLDMNQTVKSSVKKIRGSRPKIFIYANDTEAEILFKLVDAYLTKDCDVYWEPGTYTFSDIFTDMADEYGIGRVGGYWQRELPIGGNCRYFFNNSIIIGNNTGSLTDANIFGVMRSNIGNYELHDVTIIGNDMQYCVHDDGSGADGTYTHGYYNCKMVSNKTSIAQRCIGGGSGKHGVVIIDNCVFEGVDDSTDVAYHGITTAITDVCDFVVNIKNSYFKFGVQVNTLSTNQTGNLVYCGNSAIVAPSAIDGWTLKEWNNELRS